VDMHRVYHRRHDLAVVGHPYDGSRCRCPLCRRNTHVIPTIDPTKKKDRAGLRPFPARRNPARPRYPAGLASTALSPRKPRPTFRFSQPPRLRVIRRRSLCSAPQAPPVDPS
jgi:hypothetical protein